LPVFCTSIGTITKDSHKTYLASESPQAPVKPAASKYKLLLPQLLKRHKKNQQSIKSAGLVFRITMKDTPINF
jgi:hypothetical protein